MEAHESLSTGKTFAFPSIWFITLWCLGSRMQQLLTCLALALCARLTPASPKTYLVQTAGICLTHPLSRVGRFFTFAAFLGFQRV